MKHIIYILLFILPVASFAQLVTTNNQSPSQLVQNVLLGQGVDVSNITYSGAQQAIGYFNGANTHLGFNEGILITTGTVNNVPDGPHGPNRKEDATINNNVGGYNRLSQLVGNTPTYNAAVLEFDFIPYSDTVKFRYIFASEEYREYVHSEFNDVFAFFISGPGFTGYQNIAMLPNNTPVTINNINDGYVNNNIYTPQCNNCQYFTYNGDGSQSPYNSDARYIQYDGYTKPLEAVAKVECGKKYHLIIAIADVQDAYYDSGIFLEANSLNSNSIAQVSHSLSFDAFGDNQTMSEGCVSATFKLSRPANKATTSITVPVTVSGTATMGTDYNTIPTSLTLNPGETEITFSLQSIQDFLPEGTETIILKFEIPDACGNIIEKIIELKIVDTDELGLTIDGGQVNCPGQKVTLTANAVGGSGPYSYLWNTGATSQTIEVSPTSTTTYSVKVIESCDNQEATATFTVNVVPYVPMSLIPSADVFEVCRNKENILSVDILNGAPAYDINWLDASGQIIGRDSAVSVTPYESTTYTVTVTDQCGFSIDTTINYTISTPELIVDSILPVRTCPGQPVSFTVTSRGGYGQHYYRWSNGQNTPTITVTPSGSTTYTVIVTDECQSYSVSRTARVNVEVPVANFKVVNYPLTEGLPVIFNNTSSSNSVIFDWDFGDSLNPVGSTIKNPTHTYEAPGGYVIRLIATSDLGCSDTTYRAIEVMEEFYIYVPNAFTPNGDSHNHTFKVSTVNIVDFDIKIFNRWGERIFDSTDQRFEWDGTYKGLMVPNDVYVWVIDYVSTTGYQNKLTGHVTVIR